MKLSLNYISHHECPLEQREKLTLSEGDAQSLFKKAHRNEFVKEFSVIQTCNRLEFYGICGKDYVFDKFISELLREIKGEDFQAWEKYRVCEKGISAVEHFFRVAAGLESQILGENQIISQLKTAYTDSIDHKMSKLIFHKMFHNAFRVAKAVRTETDINSGAVSIALAAVELAKGKVDLSKSRVLVVGAGENSKLIVSYLKEAGVKKLVIANRNTNKAEKIADTYRADGVIEIGLIPVNLINFDLVISSTSSDKYILSCKKNADIIKELNKIKIIDVAVPRDIDPGLAKLSNIDLYNIEDLNTQINKNLNNRENQIPLAEDIVAEFVEKFDQWLSSLDVRPVIKDLTHNTMELARREARRYSGDFEDEEKLTAFAESLAKKFLHGPISFLKSGTDNGDFTLDQLQSIDIINNMFLDQDEPSE